ncbi:MAG TPA: cupin domain-containing protein [Tenuifilaceae bacterium]|nr:cupin domain-containing protein [Tenuifilaceae bacterium]
MKIATLHNAEKVPFNLDGRKMYSGGKTELIHLTLNVGDEIAVHSNPFDVIFYILEGEGTIFSNEESLLVQTNSCIFIEKDKTRGIVNSGRGVLRVLVVKIF